MKIVKVKEQQVVDTPHKVDVRKLYDHDSAQVMHITLQPGESLKSHITPVDVFFYILEGTTDVRVGDETISKPFIHSSALQSGRASRLCVPGKPRRTNPLSMKTETNKLWMVLKYSKSSW